MRSVGETTDRRPLLERRFERAGLLALAPQAIGLVITAEAPRPNTTQGGVCIVDVRGPLDAYAGGFVDSYEEIRARVQEACSSEARAIVLRIDSPGGVTSGCFETARAIRAMCARAGKALCAYVDGLACSAAYALACAADRIVLSETGVVGSVGILMVRDDYSAANAGAGVRFAIIASGERKADGHPASPITDAELREAQSLVDSMGAVFFEFVASVRSVPAAAVRALEARILHGRTAIAAGLADEVMTFDALLESFARSSARAPRPSLPQKPQTPAQPESRKVHTMNANQLLAEQALLEEVTSIGEKIKQLEASSGVPTASIAPAAAPSLGLPPAEHRDLQISMGVLEHDPSLVRLEDGVRLVLGGGYKTVGTAPAPAKPTRSPVQQATRASSSLPASASQRPPARLDAASKARLDAAMGITPDGEVIGIIDTPTRLTLTRV